MTAAHDFKDDEAFVTAARAGDYRKLLEPQRRLLEELLDLQATRKGDPKAAIERVTETASRLLRSARASVWRFDAAEDAIHCLDLYVARERKHTSGTTIRAVDVPTYFAAAREGKLIAAHDAYRDPRTAEFATSGYLPAFGVGALLDAPVFSGRSLLGVLCHEHVGPARTWEPWEELIATALGDCAGIVLSVVERPVARASGDR